MRLGFDLYCMVRHLSRTNDNKKNYKSTVRSSLAGIIISFKEVRRLSSALVKFNTSSTFCTLEKSPCQFFLYGMYREGLGFTPIREISERWLQHVANNKGLCGGGRSGFWIVWRGRFGV